MFSTLGSGATTLLRTDNGVQVFLPRDLGGVYGNFAVAAGEGTVGNRYTGGRLGFARGPFNIAAAAGETTGNGGDKFKVANVAGSYDFGPAKLTGWFHQSKFRALKQNVWLVGATVPLGQLDLRATFSKADASGGGIDANDARQLVLGAVYNLSKRTAIYATAARLENEGRAAFVVAAPPTAVPGARSTGFDLGIRHAF